MLLVSEDLRSMTVWTILYYTRHVNKLSTRSLSYLCPDLPLLLENTTTVVVSGCRPLARRLRSNVIKLRYVSTREHLFAHTHSLTFVGATSRFVWAQSSTFSTRYIIVGAIRPMLHQRDIISTATEWPMLLCFKQQLRLFLALIVVLFFIQIAYNLETEAIH